jgi:GMP synthase (glutamine-hydrolysing)
LASNSHSRIQAALIPLGKSEVWAVQYHPEFDLQQLVQLYTLYADDMVEQGFFADRPTLSAYVANLSALANNPADLGLAWQLGIDEDITNDRRRRREIINWIEGCILNH